MAECWQRRSTSPGFCKEQPTTINNTIDDRTFYAIEAELERLVQDADVIEDA